MALVLKAIARADEAAEPELFLDFAREAIPWASSLSEHELDVFLGEFLRADWRQEHEVGRIVTKWIADAKRRPAVEQIGPGSI